MENPKTQHFSTSQSNINCSLKTYSAYYRITYKRKQQYVELLWV